MFIKDFYLMQEVITSLIPKSQLMEYFQIIKLPEDILLNLIFSTKKLFCAPIAQLVEQLICNHFHSTIN